ncbi:MAG: ABC transporter ATP-binding protein/permease [Xanthomonadaceae bacterium]|jgi:putative ATP-binding cassette transporter|nr:ABC transporter ATP-binding protein/permease [Xanthomonadaceae bacterium]
MADPANPAGPPPARPAPALPRGSLLRILRLAGPYWISSRRRKVRVAVIALLLLTMGQVALSVWGNFWNRELFDALEQKSVSGVLLQVGMFALILAVSMAVTAAHLMIKRWLQLDWRRWLTEHMVRRWMEDGRHWRLQFTAGEHDNPDARIAEDIRIATESAIALGHTLVFSLLSLLLFIDILWTASGTLRVPGTTIDVPGYMVPLAFVYAIGGTLLGWLFGRRIVRTSDALQTAEASFRYGLARVREHGDAIALMHGEPRERTGSSVRFADVMRDWDRQSWALLGLVSFSTVYGALLPMFPILIAAPQYIGGAMTLGVLMQAAQAFQRVTSALSWPVDNLGEIARCRTSAERVLSLFDDIEALNGGVEGPRIERREAIEPRLSVADLTVRDPAGHVVLEHFAASIERGERVLLTGDPLATTSLFKAIAGLWSWGTGVVELPPRARIAFMPQRPFLPAGTLREALCYPEPPDTWDTAAIRWALECAAVAWLAPRLDESGDWEQVLPLRARQRLGFARVLLQRPNWIVMEEASDAFDARGERLILDMLRHELPDTTLVTISFHPGLENLHDRTIRVQRARAEPPPSPAPV